MTTQDNGGPAFPRSAGDYNGTKNGNAAQQGMTLRQYAAIKLRIPDSGTDWLDRMILKAKRDDLAAQAMQGLLSDPNIKASTNEFAAMAYTLADAMLKARSAE